MKDPVKYLTIGACSYALVASQMSEANAHAPHQPDHVVTAESDPAQWVGGVAAPSSETSVQLAVGPLYLTDARAIEYSSQLFLVAATDACDSTLPNATPLWYVTDFPNPYGGTTPGLHPMHGGRYFIRANQKLCARFYGLQGSNSSWPGLDSIRTSECSRRTAFDRARAGASSPPGARSTRFAYEHAFGGDRRAQRT
jgi:hypothetical protein